MTADTRAYSWCNLGPLAPGESSIGDDHIQGTGLCMTKGTIRLLGVVRPVAGTVVELAYSDGQAWLARLPRRLRVLSSFTNPLGAPITTISVGCDLAYMESRKPPTSNITARDANPSTPEAVWRAATLPIMAATVVDRILTALGITAAAACPLGNAYSRQEFDLSEGYVQELGKLLASEGYFCRMNDAGLLEYISKDQGLQSSIVLLEDDPIEINPINTGELPADAVFARYTSLSLKAPSDLSESGLAKRNWEEERSTGSKQMHTHTWTAYERTPVLDANGNPTYKQSRDRDGNPLYSYVTGDPAMEQAFETKAFQLEEKIAYQTTTISRTFYDSWDRVTRRTTETNGLYGYEKTETSYLYRIGSNYTAGQPQDKPSNYSDVLLERSVQYSPLGPLRAQLGFQGGFWQTYGSGVPYISSIREVQYDKNEALGISKTVTSTQTSYIASTYGSETISRMRDAGVDFNTLLATAQQLVDGGTSVQIRTEREFGLQKRPSEADRLAAANQKTPTVETTANLTWELGSPASLTSLELSPPYAPDDRITYSNGTYGVVRGDAAQKALNHARIENRIRLGHRNGLGLQLLPEEVPPQPFGLVFIRLAGCTAAYRLNGTTYTIGPDGCVATTDAVFWGAIDGDGSSPWFLMPPGSATLPAPIPITTNASPRPANAIAIPQGFNFQAPNLTSLFASLPTGQAPIWGRSLNPSVLVRPYREAVDLAVGIGAGVVIESQPWIPLPPVDLLVGIGAGASVAVRLMAGIGAGVLLEVQGQGQQGGMTPLLTATGAAPTIFDASNIDSAWYPNFDPQNVVIQFNLTQSITIVAVGIYDHGQNGLATSHGFSLYGNSGTPITLNLGSGVEEITIPSGTAAALEGSYRVVSLTSPQTLAAGSYYMLATMPTTGADPIAAATRGPGVNTWNAAVNDASGSSPIGLGFPHDAQSSPQVLDFGAVNDLAQLNFTTIGGSLRLPLGPMLFVGGN